MYATSGNGTWDEARPGAGRPGDQSRSDGHRLRHHSDSFAIKLTTFDGSNRSCGPTWDYRPQNRYISFHTKRLRHTMLVPTLLHGSHRHGVCIYSPRIRYGGFYTARTDFIREGEQT
jgi:hypothetical protein